MSAISLAQEAALPGSGVLWEVSVSGASGLGSSTFFPGDLNQDGLEDVLVGADGVDYSGEGNGIVQALYGRTGAVIWQVVGARDSRFAQCLGRISDIDGDGSPEVLVGSPSMDAFWIDGAGELLLLSGRTGLELMRWHGQVAGANFATSLVSGEDLNGDGYLDFAVGATGLEPFGVPNSGAVYLYSGSDGTVLKILAGEENERVGRDLAFAGDLDEDGVMDLFAAGHESVVAFSGLSGTPLYRLHPPKNSRDFPRSIVDLDDLDGDGFRDLAVSMNYWLEKGVVDLYSGKSGEKLDQIVPEVPSFGWRMESYSDLDGDGYPELMVGAPDALNSSGRPDGRAYLFGFAPFLQLSGTEISLSQGPVLEAGISFPQEEAGFPYALLFSAHGTGPTILSEVEIPLTRDTLFNSMLQGWAPPNVQGAFGVVNSEGKAWAFIFPDSIMMPFLGQTLFLAAVSYDSASGQIRLSSIARSFVVNP